LSPPCSPFRCSRTLVEVYGWGPRFATSEFAKPGIARRPCGAPRGVPVLAKLDDDFERGDQEWVRTILGRGDLRHEQRGHVERWSGSSSIRASPLSSTPLARRPPSSMSPRRSRFSPKSQRYSSSASTSSLIGVGEDNGTPVWSTPPILGEVRRATDTIHARLMQSFYKEKVLKHFQRPRNRGEIEGARRRAPQQPPLRRRGDSLRRLRQGQSVRR
jgi:hypothetical protein